MKDFLHSILLCALMPIAGACGDEDNDGNDGPDLSCPPGVGCVSYNLDTSGCDGRTEPACQELCNNPDWREWSAAEPARAAELEQAETTCGFTCTRTDEATWWRCVDEQRTAR